MPKIIVTTSRHTNPRVRSFVKDLARVLLNAEKLNRGKLSLHELAVEAWNKNAELVIIVGRGLRGNPGRMVFVRISDDRYFQEMILSLAGVKLIREVQGVPPPKVIDEIVAYRDDSRECVEETALALGEVLGVPLISYSNLADVKDLSQMAIVVEEFNNLPIINFINCIKLIPVGPIIKVKKMIRLCTDFKSMQE